MLQGISLILKDTIQQYLLFFKQSHLFQLDSLERELLPAVCKV